MPQRLKSLELHGYKTFAARTDFLFAGSVTAVVGPNGSGKSNIADSIRWVLGEQSFSLLRGKKTEDMIFAGSEQRARAGMASATILFDNTDGWLPIDFAEVAITRRAYRDGDNEYLLNGQRVRLKDVGELLAKSGLAERTYTIIGQGLVDAVLSLKAEERRRFFEEAAGIGLFRSRREEALRRLDATRHNLERVQDILAELQPRLRSLERQARRVQEYEQLRADLHVLLREWYGYHWRHSQQELSDARETVRVQESALEQARLAYAGVDSELAGLREQIQSQRARLNAWHRQSAELHTRREALSRETAVSEERSRALTAQLQFDNDERSRLGEETALIEERYRAAAQTVAAHEQELAEARIQLEAARAELQARQAERAALDQIIQRTRQSLSSVAGRLSVAQARLSERQSQSERQEQQLQALAQSETRAAADVKEAETRLRRAAAALQSAEQARQSAEEALSAHRKRVSELEAAQKQSEADISRLQTQLARLRAQLDVLDQAEREMTGYAAGARLLLQAARQSRLKGVGGALSAALDVPAEYELALTAALGEYLDAVIFEPAGDLDAALETLAGGQGRGVLLPLSDLTPERALPLPPVDGVVGRAADLVAAPDSLRPAVELLLGDAWVARDRRSARQVLASLKTGPAQNCRVVTLQGEVFYARGPVTAGHESKSGALSRPRQRRDLQKEIETAQGRLAEAEAQRRKLVADIGELQKQASDHQRIVETARSAEKSAQAQRNQDDLSLEKSRRQLQWQVEQRQRLTAEIARSADEARRAEEDAAHLEVQSIELRETLRQQSAALAALPLDELQERQTHWMTRQAVAAQAHSDAANRARERQSALEQARKRFQALTARIAEQQQSAAAIALSYAEAQRAASQVHEQIEQLRLSIEPAEQSLEEFEARQSSLQNIEAAARQSLSQAEHRHAQAKINLARRQEALDSLRQRIEDDFGLVAFEYTEQTSGPNPLPLSGWVEQLPIRRDLSELPADAEENIKRLRAQLRRVGPVNPEAQTEFEQVKERYEFLTVQIDDLKAAETGIKEVIAELDILMEREFRKTFDAVALEFRQIFTRLFGGGSARLILTDPEDLTTTGIDIEARLPGRREQGLSLLSGGERSLTAAALVFSLLKISPTPFCVLDEVDAMLDEANVGRFRELLRELSRQTQFVIITHNRNTVQVADAIYGVTMGQDSTSQVVSLKLDEVSQIVE